MHRSNTLYVKDECSRMYKGNIILCSKEDEGNTVLDILKENRMLLKMIAETKNKKQRKKKKNKKKRRKKRSKKMKKKKQTTLTKKSRKKERRTKKRGLKQ